MHAKLLQVFDDASRGPVGAIKLIFRTRNTALLASCASVLTIAALLIDPFAQLVLSFPSRPTPTIHQVASIGIAKAYNANTTVTANHGPPYAVRKLSCRFHGQSKAETLLIAQNAPFKLQSAIISAAFGVDPPFHLNCPTSNCTFPPLTTLGVCSTCEVSASM